MAAAAAVVTARSVFRCASVRTPATRVATGVKPARSAFRIPKQRPLSHPIFRSPVEMSCSVESLLPHHTATASALLISMLSVSRCGYGWTPEGKDETR